jgi:signal transduction histidine kinase
MDKEKIRQTKVLIPLLSGTILLSLIAFLINLTSYLRSLFGFNYEYGGGMAVLPLFLLLCLFVYLFYITKKGNAKTSSFCLIGIYYISAIYSAYTWGVDIPQALLMYALTIILTGILLGSRYGLAMTLLIAATQFILTYLQSEYIIEVNNFWKSNFVDYRDTLITSVTLSIIAIVSWLSNREIESSLSRAEASEDALRHERDQLEIRVEERTRELQKLQLEKMLQLYRFADLGKLASGILHELTNPLTVVALNLDQIDTKSKLLKSTTSPREYRSIQHTLKRAVVATQHIEKYVVAAQRQIQQQTVHKRFALRGELKQVVQLFAYRAKHEGATIRLTCDYDLYLYGNPIKFNQLMSTLIANALDSYQTHMYTSKTRSAQTTRKPINISATKKRSTIRITISDSGIGIPKSAQRKIFDPLYTTKKHTHGTGIGLALSKEIVENSFRGNIAVQSALDKGTRFTVLIPFSKEVS